jgi:hypothetical protein
MHQAVRLESAGDVVRVQAVLAQDTRGVVPALPDRAVHRYRLVARDFTPALPQLPQRDQQRPRHVPGFEFGRLADVNDRPVPAMLVVQFLRPDEILVAAQGIRGHISGHVDRVLGRPVLRRVGQLAIFEVHHRQPGIRRQQQVVISLRVRSAGIQIVGMHNPRERVDSGDFRACANIQVEAVRQAGLGLHEQGGSLGDLAADVIRQPAVRKRHIVAPPATPPTITSRLPIRLLHFGRTGSVHLKSASHSTGFAWRFVAGGVSFRARYDSSEWGRTHECICFHRDGWVAAALRGASAGRRAPAKRGIPAPCRRPGTRPRFGSCAPCGHHRRPLGPARGTAAAANGGRRGCTAGGRTGLSARHGGVWCRS